MRAKTILVTLLVGAAGAASVALLAMRAPDAQLADSPAVETPHIVNDRSFISEILDLPPKPLTDCAAVREWMTVHRKAFSAFVKRDGYSMELQYRPATCAACMELPDAELNQPELSQRAKELAGADLYHLRILPGKDGETPRAGFDWQPRIVEVVGQDTIPCTFIHVETMPPGVPHQSVLLGFDAQQDTRDRRVLIKDPDGSLDGAIVLALPTGGPFALAQALNPSQFPQP